MAGLGGNPPHAGHQGVSRSYDVQIACGCHIVSSAGASDIADQQPWSAVISGRQSSGASRARDRRPRHIASGRSPARARAPRPQWGGKTSFGRICNLMILRVCKGVPPDHELAAVWSHRAEKPELAYWQLWDH